MRKLLTLCWLLCLPLALSAQTLPPLAPAPVLASLERQAPPAQPEKSAVPGLVPIRPEHRVMNVQGNCAWASVETLCRHLGITQGYGLSQGRHGASPSPMGHTLIAKGIHFKQQVDRRDTSMIQDACKQGLGCMIGVHGNHAITCCGWNEEGPLVIDNTGPWALRVQQWSLAYFKQHFDGWTCVVYPGNAPTTPPQARPASPDRPRLVPEDRFNPRAPALSRMPGGC